MKIKRPPAWEVRFFGVGKGARTLNIHIHSVALCQLSYAHHNGLLSCCATAGRILSRSRKAIKQFLDTFHSLWARDCFLAAGCQIFDGDLARRQLIWS